MKTKSIDKNNLKEIYEFEKELSNKIRYTKSSAERKMLYQKVYSEYYDKYPNHPFINQDNDLINAESTRKQLDILNSFIKNDWNYVEIGPGAGVVSFEISKRVKSVTLVDISDAPTRDSEYPSNAKFLLSNGVNLPKELKELDVVYSSQLMEHLHEDDAKEQLEDIFNALTLNGKYICITPHRYSGPHDISKHFDSESTCFHLKEYTVTEIIKLFRGVGFRKVQYFIAPKAKLIRLPNVLIYVVEYLFHPLPQKIRRRLFRMLPLRSLLNFVVVGIK